MGAGIWIHRKACNNFNDARPRVNSEDAIGFWTMKKWETAAGDLSPSEKRSRARHVQTTAKNSGLPHSS